MTKRSPAVVAQVVAVLYAIFGVFAIAVATQLAEDPLWFRAVVGLGGVSAVACGVTGCWLSVRWYRRLAGGPVRATERRGGGRLDG